MRSSLVVACFGMLVFGPWVKDGRAQPLGAFRWQLQPFCNVITVNATQNGAVYTLDGFDDQCGAQQRAPLAGTATPNPDGTIGFDLHGVTVPGGVGGDGSATASARADHEPRRGIVERGYRAVNYSKLPLLAIQAIKELEMRTQTLQRQLDATHVQFQELQERWVAVHDRLQTLEAALREARR